MEKNTNTNIGFYIETMDEEILWIPTDLAFDETIQDDNIVLAWAETTDRKRLPLLSEVKLKKLTISSMLMCNNVYSDSFSENFAVLSDEEKSLYSDIYNFFGLSDPYIKAAKSVCSSDDNIDIPTYYANADDGPDACKSKSGNAPFCSVVCSDKLDDRIAEPREEHNTDGGKTSLYNIPDWVKDLDDLAEAWSLSPSEFNAIKAIKGASLIRQGKIGRHAASSSEPARDNNKAIYYTQRMLTEYNRKNLHLCDSCQFEFVDCPSANISFGTGYGNDNVYECDSYRKDN